MKLNSVAGVAYYVSNIDRTVKFYTDLGFLTGVHEKSYATVRLNWFWIEFFQQEMKKGATSQDIEGVIVSIKVDDAGEAYKELLGEKLKPETEPTEKLKGKKEFVLKDPDGYTLLFFSKK